MLEEESNADATSEEAYPVHDDDEPESGASHREFATPSAISRASSHGSSRSDGKENKKSTYSSFGKQTYALWIKNSRYQRRQLAGNICMALTPIIFLVLIIVLQHVIDNQVVDSERARCGCLCLECCDYVDVTGDGTFEYMCYTADNIPDSPFERCSPYSQCRSRNTSQCGVQYSTTEQIYFCEIDDPVMWPAMIDMPLEMYRKSNLSVGETLPAGASPLLYTGENRTVADTMAELLLARDTPLTGFTLLRAAGQIQQALPEEVQGSTDALTQLAASNPLALIDSFNQAFASLGLVLGTAADTTFQMFLEPGMFGVASEEEADADRGFSETLPVYYAMPECTDEIVELVGRINDLFRNFTGTNLECVPSPTVWMDNAEAINSVTYCGWRDSRCIGVDGERKDIESDMGVVVGDNSKIVEYTSALFDFKTTAENRLDVAIWYNDTNIVKQSEGYPKNIQRVNMAMNLASDAFLHMLKGSGYDVNLMGVMGMPKPETGLSLDFASLLGPLFYMWVLMLPLPLMVYTLVYEKQFKLRMMMQMHGLRPAAYWVVNYVWYALMYACYVVLFIVVASLVGLSFFTENNYAIQAVFYFLYGNLQISWGFYLSAVFITARFAVVSMFLMVFTSGLVASIVLVQCIETCPAALVTVLQVFPPFGLFRGLWEFGQYAFHAQNHNTSGMTWSNLSDSDNGIVTVWIIFAVEWWLFLVAAWYIEQVTGGVAGIKRHPLFFLGYEYSKDGKVKRSNWFAWAKRSSKTSEADLQSSRSEVDGGGGKFAPDVLAERMRVDELVESENHDFPILLDRLKKVYPKQGKNPPKVACESLSLAVGRCHVFGLLGPNGAGKTTSIGMMTGFLAPSSGRAFIEGNNILTDMEKIYSLMGVCPQHDLLWGTLTGHEHLMFYGRLKNLSGEELRKAVDAALQSVNLLAGGVGNKVVAKYSGGMKRRLSVAISLIGEPSVVYMDEPSTGLDPASRRSLWNAIVQAKKGRSIILTTHSMEEAEALCDSIGIFVDGKLQCIGNPKELTSRFGGYFNFTITTNSGGVQAAREFIMRLSPNATRTYQVGGTQKFELPNTDVTMPEIFNAMRDSSKHRFELLDWNLANATLEEVFIKITKIAGAQMSTYS